MVQGIADDSILIGEQRLEHTAVGIEACGIENGIFRLEILRDGLLQLLVDVLRTTDETHRRHTEATLVHHLLRSLDDALVVAQAQIVVGTKVQHFLSRNLNGCTLRALDEALFLVESCLANLGQCLAEMLFYFSVHDVRLMIERIMFDDISCKITKYISINYPLRR